MEVIIIGKRTEEEKQRIREYYSKFGANITEVSDMKEAAHKTLDILKNF